MDEEDKVLFKNPALNLFKKISLDCGKPTSLLALLIDNSDKSIMKEQEMSPGSHPEIIHRSFVMNLFSEPEVITFINGKNPDNLKLKVSLCSNNGQTICGASCYLGSMK
jgi:hypothetical protein